MSKFELGKAIWFLLVLIAALGFITWTFFSGNNGIFATTTEKDSQKENKEKEIKVKVLDEGKEKTEDSEENAEDSGNSSKPDITTPKDFDKYMRNFEETQRQMEKMMEEMRREHEQMLRDFMGGAPTNDPLGRDDWNITPRFRNMPRGGFFRSMPKDFGTEIFGEDFDGAMGFSTAMDVQEDKDKIVVKCDLPGMEKDKIEVTIKGNQLTIKGTRETVKEERKDDQGNKIILNERSSGGFARTITLPPNAEPDKITSKYENGVLEIVVPKTAKDEPEEKKIIIKTE
jgi:HSP20 family protein